jgi:AcrR family transcriptional regulator
MPRKSTSSTRINTVQENGEASQQEAEPAGSQAQDVQAVHTRSDARERIMQAAQKLFGMRGFDATPTKEIAWEAGVPSGLVFYYFPTKRSLLLAIIDESGLLPELKAVIQAEVASHNDPRLVLTSVGISSIEHITTRAGLIRILVNDLLTHPEMLEHLALVYNDGLSLVSDYLQKQIDSGRLRPFEVNTMVRLFVGSILMGVLDPVDDKRKFMSTTVDMLLRGLIVED